MEISVQQIKSGDSKAFEKVYKQYHEKLYFYILKHTQSAYLSEEAVQLTFIKIWEKRESLSLELGFPIQLFRIAKSTMIDLLRKERKNNKLTVVPAENASELSAETDIMYKDELQRIHGLIEGMPTARKTVFKLSRFEELSYKEIAERLSISPKTVENHIGQAIRRLRDNLFFIFFIIITYLTR